MGLRIFTNVFAKIDPRILIGTNYPEPLAFLSESVALIALILTWRRNAHKRNRGQHPLVPQHQLQRPSHQLAGHDDQRAERQQEGHRHEALHDHQPGRQQVLADHVVLLKKVGFKLFG